AELSAHSSTAPAARSGKPWRLLAASVLALLIGAALGTSPYADPTWLWNRLSESTPAAGELKLRLDDSLQRPPAR
ncbi:MAG TPA: hypothetical protein VNZ68_10005, partial [Rhodocyclaceae bacterium]|nr:hypothetical protein [Rhodocyclaceae bacterium]